MNNKNNVPKKQHLFGRNSFTFFIFIPLVIVFILCVFVGINYISVYNSNKIKPFEHKSAGVLFEQKDEQGNVTSSNSFLVEDAKRIKAGEFLDFGYILTCTSYNEDSSTAVYKFSPYKTEETDTITNDKISVALCLKANWVGYVGYSSTTPSTVTLSKDEDTAKNNNSSTYKKTLTISSLKDFPATADTWPIKVKVNEPEIYLYLSYSYQENGQNLTKSFIIEYSYDELIPESGGIRK